MTIRITAQPIDFFASILMIHSCWYSRAEHLAVQLSLVALEPNASDAQADHGEGRQHLPMCLCRLSAPSTDEPQRQSRQVVWRQSKRDLAYRLRQEHKRHPQSAAERHGQI